MTGNGNMDLASIARIVDELGLIKAEVSELTAREEALKAKLTGFGAGSYDGVSYRATISKFVRETLDMKAVRAKLSAQFVRAHTSRKECIRIDVAARTRAVTIKPEQAAQDSVPREV